MAANSPKLTPWAERYGVMYNGSNQSGYTPTEAIIPGQAETHEILNSEQFQKQRLLTFTTRELGQMDALTTRELKSGSLQNAIIPFLQRENWETAAPSPDLPRTYLYQLADGTGLWSASNNEVWDVLRPCVTIASRILILMLWRKVSDVLYPQIVSGHKTNSQLPKGFIDRFINALLEIHKSSLMRLTVGIGYLKI
ncbi:hypothetical protein LSUE1_G001889 [Lachnellula suecica]|uniref:Uncharacterized protein n=1 Tax=Lachnellula suecica TaxID=602035 RepID=A0A8T9CC92_9HELO|nr:hypothetical protein LSUE1_G001889 [Lachnellula suecica]